MITAQNSRRSITRNSAFFKKIPDHVRSHRPTREVELEDAAIDEPDVVPPSPEPAFPLPTTETPPATGTPPRQPAAEPARRSARVRKPPEKLKDYQLQ